MTNRNASNQKADNSGRRSRFVSSPTHRLNLGDRDRELLADLYQHQAMSRSQIQALHFGSVARCNARLRQLFDHELVTRWYPPMAPFGGQAVYMVGRSAVSIVAAHLSVDEDEVRRHVRSRTLTFVEHTLAVVDFYLALRDATAREGTEIETWLPELQCRHEYEIVGGQGPARLEVFKPDAFFRLLPGSGLPYANHFVEIDLGHTSSSQFVAKLVTHQRYLDSGLFAEIYGCDVFSTLIVTTSPARVKNLVRLVEGYGSMIFWFATFEDITRVGPLGEVWIVPSNVGTRRLIR